MRSARAAGRRVRPPRRRSIGSERMQPTLVDSENLFRLVQFFDILAAVVFAVSGALVASRKGLDVMAFMWFRRHHWVGRRSPISSDLTFWFHTYSVVRGP